MRSILVHRVVSLASRKEHAGVMKLVDVPDSKSGGLLARVGSSPTAGKLIT